MGGKRKQLVSLRMSTTDLFKIKEIAKRLNVRESDVLRFAIRSTLGKLAPLHEDTAKGVDLMPAFIECGSDLCAHFGLDVEQLHEIINAGVEDMDKRVERDDVNLLALAGAPEHLLMSRLRRVAETPGDLAGPHSLLRRYLMEKYTARQPAREDPLATTGV